MSTDDCSEIGSGPCPCGKGIITVESCSPDHAYVKAHQVSMNGYLHCEDCRKVYAFHDAFADRNPRLVLRSDLEKRSKAQQEANGSYRKVEEHPDFKKLKSLFYGRLESEKSKAAQYRLLSANGMSQGSLEHFRRHGCHFHSYMVPRALKMLKLDMSELEDLARRAEHASEMARPEPAAIKTGITGLYA